MRGPATEVGNCLQADVVCGVAFDGVWSDVRCRVAVAVLGAALTVAGCSDDGADPAGTRGPATGDLTLDGEVVDGERGRRIPYRVYAPAGDGPAPVVLVSHGGAGGRQGYTRGGHLGTTLAEHGFLALHIGHLPSAIGQARTDRPAAVSHVLDRLEAGEIELPAGFVGTPDLTQVGVAGHSFGAYTAHAVGGAVFDRNFTDERVDAIAPISPQGAGQFGAFDRGPTDNTWARVIIPAYNLVGGEEVDGNVVGTIDEEDWRLTPFRRYPAVGDKFLTVIDGQQHSDLWRTGSDGVSRFVADEIARFFEVYVKGDESAEPCAIGQGPLEGVMTDRLASAEGSRIADCP